MRGVFDEEEPEKHRDTELTLSTTTVLAIFFGLVLVCGLFFGLGFAVGRYGPAGSSAEGQQPAAQTAAPAGASRPKPSAAASIVSQLRRAASRLPFVQTGPTPAANLLGGASATGGSNGQPAPKPALPPAVGAPQPVATSNVQPAIPPGAGPMVQIAEVAHTEDADVLVSALRKRGYQVTARREAGDGMIHVRIGPFANRNDAAAMRQKLLNDGYNAILQP